jgi:hypothetical protein
MLSEFNEKYNGICGVGIMVGLNSALPLYASVKNKRCAICEVDDKCHQNLDYSSSSMEAAVAVECRGISKQIRK